MNILKKLLFVALFSFIHTSFAQSTAGSAAAAATAVTGSSTAREETARDQTAATTQPTPTTVSTTTQTAVAKPTTLLTRPLSGYYIGLGLDVPASRGFTGLMPKLLLGYGSIFGVCKDLYFGAEIFGGIGSLPISSNQRRRINSYLGAGIFPGVLIYETTIGMIRLGYETARYTKTDNNRSGFFVGLGLQTVLSERWDVRYAYDYMPNGNLNQYSLDFIFKIC